MEAKIALRPHFHCQFSYENGKECIRLGLCFHSKRLNAGTFENAVQSEVI